MRRLAELSKGASEAIDLLAVTASIREADLHRKFAAHRTEGEWFDPAPEILEEIRRHGGDPENHEESPLASSSRGSREILAPDLRSPIPISDPDHRPRTREGDPAAAPPSVAEVTPESGPSDFEKAFAEVSRVAMLSGRPDVPTRIRRLVGMAEAQSNGRRPIAPYVAQAVDKLASKIADGETFKPSAALSWIVTAADGAWRERRLDAKHAPTEGDELAASYAADWQRARARGVE